LRRGVSGSEECRDRQNAAARARLLPPPPAARVSDLAKLLASSRDPEFASDLEHVQAEMNARAAVEDPWER
jgi:hypothetical protein